MRHGTQPASGGRRAELDRRNVGLCSSKPQGADSERLPYSAAPSEVEIPSESLPEPIKQELEALGRKGQGGARRKSKTCQRTRFCPWRHMCGPRALPTTVGASESNGLLLLEAPRIGIQPIPAQGSPMSPQSPSLSLLPGNRTVGLKFLWRLGPQQWGGPGQAAGPPGAHFPPRGKRRGAPGKCCPWAPAWRESEIQRAPRSSAGILTTSAGPFCIQQAEKPQGRSLPLDCNLLPPTRKPEDTKRKMKQKYLPLIPLLT